MRKRLTFRAAVPAVLVGASAVTAWLIWVLRQEDPMHWWQSLIPEFVGFILGSIATYVIIERLISRRRRKIWRAVESQILYDQALYAARVIDAIALRYNHASSYELMLQTSGDPADSGTHVDVADVVSMYRFGMRMSSYYDAALLVLRQHGKLVHLKSAPVEQARLEIDAAVGRAYYVALAMIQNSFAGQADAAVPKLRRVLKFHPDLDLLIRLTDEPIVARRAFEMQRALRNLNSLFDPDLIPLTSKAIRRACDSIGAESPTPTDLETLSRYEHEASLAHEAVVAVSSMVATIGVLRSRWTRDASWRQLRKAAFD